MKRVLFATTLLLTSAGFALAVPDRRSDHARQSFIRPSGGNS